VPAQSVHRSGLLRDDAQWSNDEYLCIGGRRGLPYAYSKVSKRAPSGSIVPFVLVPLRSGSGRFNRVGQIGRHTQQYTFAIQWRLKISPHLKLVATLPCGYYYSKADDNKVVQRRVWNVWGSLISDLLQIYFWVLQWKNFENRSTFLQLWQKHGGHHFYWTTLYGDHVGTTHHPYVYLSVVRQVVILKFFASKSAEIVCFSFNFCHLSSFLFLCSFWLMFFINVVFY